MGRIANVAVVVRTMSFLVTPNWWASVSKRKTTTKKSNASRVQPRKPAATACRFADMPDLSVEKFAMRRSQDYVTTRTNSLRAKKARAAGGSGPVGVQLRGAVRKLGLLPDQFTTCVVNSQSMRNSSSVKKYSS